MDAQIKFGAGLVSIQVLTNRMDGREFPAMTVLCDITDEGNILWNNTDAKNFRKQVIAQLREQNQI